MLRRPESGGFLLGLVGGIALATFAYIAVVLFADPSKATTVAEGVEEATEQPDKEETPVDEDEQPRTPNLANVTDASQAIIDRYKELKYPTLTTMPDDFNVQILTAYREGSLFDIERLDAAGGTLHLVGTTGYGSCGGYGQPLCFIFAERNDELNLVYIVDAFIGSPRFSIASVEMEKFGDDDDEFMLVRPFGDAGHWEEAGYLVNVATTEVTPIAALEVQEGTSTVITSGTSQLTFDIERTGEMVADDGSTQYQWRIVVADIADELMTVEKARAPTAEQLVHPKYDTTATEPGDNIALWILGDLYLYQADEHKLIPSEMP